MSNYARTSLAQDKLACVAQVLHCDPYCPVVFEHQTLSHLALDSLINS
jgi:hypothetical protein